MATLPAAYRWLANEPGPRILLEFLEVYGVTETPGPGNNPTILAWAREVGLERIYKSDATAWCGLAQAYVAGEAGWDYAPRGNSLWARNWAYWGNPSPSPMLGDVLVFSRGTGGHVGLYVGHDEDCYHVIGGNQSDRVSFTRIVKSRLLAARRCPWRIAQPANVRPIVLAPNGAISSNEA